MRPIVAAAVTTLLPMIVGQRWISGPPITRWSLGGVIGIVLVALGALFGGLAGFPLIGATVALLIGWLCGPRWRFDVAPATASRTVTRVLIAILALGSALMIMSLFRPVPSWDAWFTWSLKSKALAAARSFDAPVFLSRAYKWSSQDYPTLLPSWQALAYIVSGDLTVSWPLQFQQAWLWTCGALALVSLRSTYAPWGFLLPLAWIASPQLVWQAMQGYADVPMTVMLVLGTIVVAANPRDRRAQVAGGLLLSGAALTKSEGAPLVALVLLCLLATTRPSLVLGVSPAIVAVAILPWLFFTRSHGLTNQLITGSVLKSVLAGAHLSELPQVLSTMLGAMFSPVRWGLLVPGCLLAAVIARTVDVRLALAAFLQFALIAAVYDAAGSNQGISLEDFMRSNVDRVLITPLGILTLSIGLGARRSTGTADVDVPATVDRSAGRATAGRG